MKENTKFWIGIISSGIGMILCVYYLFLLLSGSVVGFVQILILVSFIITTIILYHSMKSEQRRIKDYTEG